MAAKLGRAALVADRPRRFRPPARPRARCARASPPGPSSACSAAVARSGIGATAASAIRALRAHAVRQRELRGDADDGDVELAPRRVAQVVAAAVRPGRRHDELDQQLVRRQHRLPHAGEEVGDAARGARPRARRSPPRRPAPAAAAPCRPTARRCRGCRPRWPGCAPGPSRRARRSRPARDSASRDGAIAARAPRRHRRADAQAPPVVELERPQPGDAGQVDHAARA